MNRLTPFILLGIALLLFCFIYFVERHAGNPELQPVAVGLFPDFDPSKVAAMEIVRSNSAIRLERTNDSWRLTAPVIHPARQPAIELLLQAVRDLTSEIQIPSDEYQARAGGLSDYGLQPPETTLVFYHRNQRIVLAIGRKSPVSEKAYVQVNGAPIAHLIDGSFLGKVPQSLNDWRDPRLIDLHGLSFNRLEVRPLSQYFALQRDPIHSWRMIRPMEARADTNRVEHLLRHLQDWSVTRFLEESPSPDLENLGLQPPEMELVLAQGPREVLVVQFGKSPTNDPTQVYARRSNPTNIVLLSTNLVNELRLPYTEFRDRRLVTVDEALVDQVEIKGEERFTIRRTGPGSWQVTEPGVVAADTGLVGNLLNNLNSLQIVEFKREVVTDFSEFGLTNPLRQYVLKSSQTNAAGLVVPQILAAIDFGSSDIDKVFVRRGDENAVYAVALGDSLPRAAFELRHRQFLHFESTNVSTINITQSGRHRKLVRNPALEWTFAQGSQGIINTFSLEETLHQLGKLAAVEWVARGDGVLDRFGIPQVNHQVTLEVRKGDQVEIVTLAFGGQSPARHIYASTLLDNRPTVFEFPAVRFDDLQGQHQKEAG